MSPSRPVGAGNPDPLDLDAAEQLERNETGRLELVRAQAEKWIGGISALGALVGTVLVVKGRDSVSDIAPAWRAAAATGFALALVVLPMPPTGPTRERLAHLALWREISPVPLAGLHARLSQARRTTAAAALAHVATAVRSVFVAIALIAAAVGVAWFAPTRSGTPEKAICVYDKGQLVVELTGPSVAVRQSAAGTTIGPCR